MKKSVNSNVGTVTYLLITLWVPIYISKYIYLFKEIMEAIPKIASKFWK